MHQQVRFRASHRILADAAACALTPHSPAQQRGGLLPGSTDVHQGVGGRVQVLAGHIAGGSGPWHLPHHLPGVLQPGALSLDLQ